MAVRFKKKGGTHSAGRFGVVWMVWPPDPVNVILSSGKWSPPPPALALRLPEQSRDGRSTQKFVPQTPRPSESVPLVAPASTDANCFFGGDRRSTDARDAKRHQGGKEEDTEIPQGRSDGVHRPTCQTTAQTSRLPRPTPGRDIMFPHDG